MTEAPTAELKRSEQESIKDRSKFLKGTVAAELEDLSRGDVTDEAYELLKFHGTYFGHNRDTATERKKQKLEKEYEFMVRTRIPGGRITAEQYLALDDTADAYANGTLRVTTRQTIQFHVILKKNLKKHIAAINHAWLSTQSACGDVVRNITAPSAPLHTPKYIRLRQDTDRIAEFVRPKTSAYKELWLDEAADEIRERDVALTGAMTDGEDYEPLYGAHYMPRKFKIGLALPEDNSVDMFTHDLGIVPIWESENLRGYNIYLGGGLGMSHEPAVEWKDKKTYPRLADPIAFIAEPDLINAVEAVVKLQRDFGDRSNRKHARLKYVVQEQGLEWTRKTFEEYFARTNPSAKPQAPVAIAKFEIPSWMGWHKQGNGKWFFGLPIPSGRIVDYTKPHASGYSAQGHHHFKDAQFRTGLRKAVEHFKRPLVLTATDEILFADIEENEKVTLEKILKDHHIPLAEEHTPMELNFMTCVSLPTCAKALAESERIQFSLMENIQQTMNKNGIGNEKMAIRVTGCPNGCARPYVGDIGIVGRMPGHYVLFIGGDFEGTRLNTKVFDKVPEAELSVALDPMFALYASQKKAGEGFGDFCHRQGIENVKQHAIAALKPQNYKWLEAA